MSTLRRLSGILVSASMVIAMTGAASAAPPAHAGGNRPVQQGPQGGPKAGEIVQGGPKATVVSDKESATSSCAPVTDLRVEDELEAESLETVGEDNEAVGDDTEETLGEEPGEEAVDPNCGVPTSVGKGNSNANLTGRGQASEKNPNADSEGKVQPAIASLQERKDAKIADVKADSRAQAKAERAKGQTEPYLVYVNGERLNVTPVARSGRTLVPFRALAEFLGADVDWHQPTRTVIMVKGDVTVELTIGDAYAYINGEQVELTTPAEIVGSSTFVPLRFIAEALGADVDYDPETGAITIITTDEIVVEEPSDDAEESGDDAEEPGDDAEEPGDDAQESGDDAEEPGDDAEEPGDDAQESGDDAEEPGDGAEESGDDAEEPGDDAEEPGDDAEEPGDDAEESGDDAEEPGDDVEEPGDGAEGDDSEEDDSQN